MPSVLRSRASRWAVPVVAVTAVGAAIGFGSIMAGASSPDLPDRTAADLLASVAGSEQPFSGTVVQTSRLGLPDLPEAVTQGVGPVALLTGSHTARIWYSVTRPGTVRADRKPRRDRHHPRRRRRLGLVQLNEHGRARRRPVPRREGRRGTDPGGGLAAGGRRSAAGRRRPEHGGHRRRHRRGGRTGRLRARPDSTRRRLPGRGRQARRRQRHVDAAAGPGERGRCRRARLRGGVHAGHVR